MRILIIGDGLALTTGFAQVIRHTAQEFIARGHEVAQVASLDLPPYCRSTPYEEIGVTPYFPHGGIDPVGFNTFPIAVEDFKPDVLFVNCDPGMAWNWQVRFSKENTVLPALLYAPVEGAPISPIYAGAFRDTTAAYTYTQWSTDRLKEQYDLDVPFVYHGVDLDIWKPLLPDKRAQIRRDLGWEDKFVISYVARNVGRKAHDRLIKAMRFLLDGNEAAGIPARSDYLLYLHCKQFDDHQIQGWDLGWFAHVNGVEDYVQFAEKKDAARGESTYSLAAKLAAADLYISPAKVEGFGLPLVEAMACGLPVVIPQDNGNQEEVVGYATACKLAPIDWDTAFNGAQLCSVDPHDIAYAAHHIRSTPQLRRKAAELSLKRAKEFSWDCMAATLADSLESLVKHAVAV